MGEQTTRTARVAAAATASIGAALLLASCSRLGLGPGAATTTEPVDPAAVSSSAAPASSASADPVPATSAAEPTPDASAASTVSVVPFITSAVYDAKSGAIDVSALVPKVVERGGTCTATATLGDVEVHASGPAVAASSYTGCPQLQITGSALTSGTWTVRVAYRSDESSGTSAAKHVGVE